MIEKLNTLIMSFIRCYQCQILPRGIPNFIAMRGVERVVGDNEELIDLQRETRSLVDVNTTVATKIAQLKVVLVMHSSPTPSNLYGSFQSKVL